MPPEIETTFEGDASYLQIVFEKFDCFLDKKATSWSVLRIKEIQLSSMHHWPTPTGSGPVELLPTSFGGLSLQVICHLLSNINISHRAASLDKEGDGLPH